MMFNKDIERIDNDNIILEGKPNLFISCKKAYLLFILLGVIFYVRPIIINFVEIMQSQLGLTDMPLNFYVSLISILIILLIFIYVIWIVASALSKEYIISDHRISYKSGLIFQKTIHMPYSKIQDIVVSQGIFGRIVSVGTVTAYSAYDGSKLELENINDPKHVESVIFDEINRLYDNYNFRTPYNSYNNVNPNNQYPNDYNNRPPNYQEFNNYNPNNRNNSYNPNERNNNYYPDNQQYNNQNYNESNIKDRYRNSNSSDSYNPPQNINKSQKKSKNPFNSRDFPFLNEDKKGFKEDSNYNNSNNHNLDVNDYVENPEEYQNSSAFSENNHLNQKNPRDNSHNRQNYDNNEEYTNNDYHEEDNFDQTMNQAINNMDGNLKFKKNNDYNSQPQDYPQNQQNYNRQNPQQFNSQNNQNFNQQQNPQQFNSQNNQNPNQYNQNPNQYNQNPNQYNQNQVNSQNPRNNQRTNKRGNESKFNAVLERHAKKFEKHD